MKIKISIIVITYNHNFDTERSSLNSAMKSNNVSKTSTGGKLKSQYVWKTWKQCRKADQQ